MLEYSVIAGLIGLASIVGLKSAGSTAQQTAAIITGELGGEVNGGDDWEDDWEDEDDGRYWPWHNFDEGAYEESYIDENGVTHYIEYDYDTGGYDEDDNPYYYDENGDICYYDQNGNRFYKDEDGNGFYRDEDGNQTPCGDDVTASLRQGSEALAWTDENGVAHIQKVDADGNVIASGEQWTDDEGITHTVETDASGNMLWESESWTDEEGVLRTNQYDSNGLISQEESWTDEDGTYYDFAFDANGQLTKRHIENSDQDVYIWQETYEESDEGGEWRQTGYFDSNGMYHQDTYSYGEDRKETYNDKGIMTEMDVVYPSGNRAIGSLDDNGVWTQLSQEPSQDGSGYVTVGGYKEWESSNYPGKNHHQDIDAAGNVTGEYLTWSTYTDIGPDASHTQELDNEGLATGNITTRLNVSEYDDETGSEIDINYTQQRDSESGAISNAEATWVAEDGTSYKYTAPNKNGEGTYYYMSEYGDWVEMAPENTSQLQDIDHSILFYNRYL